MTTPTDKSEVSLDHINPTVREKALIDQYNKALTTVASVAKERDDLRSQVEALHADGAVMRGALERVKKWTETDSHASDGDFGYFAEEIVPQVAQSLSTNAGRDLLARYREAVTLLNEQKRGIFSIEWDGWNRRRDTLLATVKGGVE